MCLKIKVKRNCNVSIRMHNILQMFVVFLSKYSFCTLMIIKLAYAFIYQPFTLSLFLSARETL